MSLLVLWSCTVLIAYALVVVRQTATLDYPASRFLFEDIFRTFGDGHLMPRPGEGITVSLVILVGGPIAWVQFMTYYALDDLLGGVQAINVAHLSQMMIYLLGTPLVYRLLRHGNADRSVAFVIAAAYAFSPFVLTRMLVYNAPCPAPFLLWSELGRVEGRPGKRAIGLMAATLTYPLTGFSALILALQDYLFSAGPQRRSNRRILLATAGALAVVHFAILGLYQRAAHPELRVGLRMVDGMFGYRVFPFDVGTFFAVPVKLFEIAVFVAGSCVSLLAHPFALAPAIVDLVYYAATGEGVRDHGMVLSSIGLFTVLGARNSLFRGGSTRRSRVLIAGALFAIVYGHALAGPTGLIQQALAAPAPRPHADDVRACVAPGEWRCVVPPTLYPAFVGYCRAVDTYEPADLESLRIEDAATTVFVAPARLDYNTKGRRSGEPGSDKRILAALAAKVRSGQLHAGVCGPWLALLRSPSAGPSDPAAADYLDPSPP